ncbi:circumsporozoite protein-like [Sesbania bispinosa]|nr:circumsporozoite protein-like [Sesbania bispinosa]
MQVTPLSQERSLLLVIPGKSLEDGLRELRWDCDTDVLDMCIASMRNDGKIEVFIEHPVVENPTFSKSRADVGEKEGAENVKEKDESGFVHEENEAAENVVGNDEEGFVNEQNVGAEETNEGGMDVTAEGWKPSQPTTQETQGNQTPSDSAASAQGPQSEIDISQSQPTPQLDLSQNDNNSQQLGHPGLTPTADTTRTQPPTMTIGAPYRPPAFPPHSATRPQVATQPANLRYRPPPVRGVTRQPLPAASPTSAANPLGTNMTFMPTPGYRAPPPPNP